MKRISSHNIWQLLILSISLLTLATASAYAQSMRDASEIEVLTYSSDDIDRLNGPASWMSPARISLAHYYTAEDLVDHVGKKITDIEFYPLNEGGSYTIAVWGNDTRSEVLASTTVTGVPARAVYKVALETPFVIPADRDLYIGVQSNDDLTFAPLAIDYGPAVEGKGDLFALNETDPFMSLANMSFRANGYIKAYLLSDAIKNYPITIEQEGEGDVSLSVPDPKAVPVGTSVTVTAIPANGYELASISANGQDITASRTFVVEEATVVKVVFTSVGGSSEPQGVLTQSTEKLNGGYALGAFFGAYTIYAAQLFSPTELTPYVGGAINSIDIYPQLSTEVCEYTAYIWADKDHSIVLASQPISSVQEMQINNIIFDTPYVIQPGQELYIGYVATTSSGQAIGLDAGPAKAGQGDLYAEEDTPFASLVESGIDNNIFLRAYVGDKKVKTYKVTTETIGDGTIELSGADDWDAVPEGTRVTVIASPAENMQLKDLLANDVRIVESKTFVVMQDTKVVATFAPNTYTIYQQIEGEGKVVIKGIDKLTGVPYGTEITIIAEPELGYKIQSLTLDQQSIESGTTVVVTKDLVINAVFVEDLHPVTYETNEFGSIEIHGWDDLNQVPAGTTLVVVPKPLPADEEYYYTLDELTANGVDIIEGRQFVVQGPTHIKAVFGKNVGITPPLQSKVKVRLTPNPVKELLYVTGAPSSATVTIFTLEGVSCMTAKTSEDGDVTIDVSELLAGNYIVAVADETHRITIL